MSSSDITTNPTESDCCTRTGNLSYCDVPRMFQEYSFLADNDNSREYHTLQICHANEDMKPQIKEFHTLPNIPVSLAADTSCEYKRKA